MAKLHRIELSDAISHLPDIQSFDPKTASASQKDELFLCALGFEERCLTLPRLLSQSDYRTELAVCLLHSTNQADNDVNRNALRSALQAFSSRVEFLEADTPDFVNRFQKLVASTRPRRPKRLPRITFDCSVTANRLLVRSATVLLKSDSTLRILYSEAAIYHPTKEEMEVDPARWTTEGKLGLERGVSNVMVSPDHPGHHLDPLPDCVILFPTFKPERSRAVIDFVDPSLVTAPGQKVVWLIGIPHLQDDAWRMEAMRDVNSISKEMPQYSVSTFNYKDTLQTLEALHGRLSTDFKLSLSPIGSKMQALGTSLFHYLHPDVRIVFAAPEEYNASQYSAGCKAIWEVGFGSVPDLRTRLDQVGTLTVED